MVDIKVVAPPKTNNPGARGGSRNPKPKVEYRDLPGGGFESGGVQFSKEGKIEEVTSRRGEKILKKAVSDYEKAYNTARVEQEQRYNLEASRMRSTAFSTDRKEIFPTATTNRAAIERVLNLQSRDSGQEFSAIKRAALLAKESPAGRVFERIRGSSRVREIVDVISGGQLTRRDLARRQESLNNAINLFNQRYGGKELSEQEYRDALRAKEILEGETNKINEDRRRFGESTRAKIGAALTVKGLQEQIALERSRPEYIKKQNLKIRDLETRYLKNPTKSNAALLNAAREDLRNALEGVGPKIYAGDLPIGIPASASFNKVSYVKFLGLQRTSGNRIITDLAFVTKDGRIGMARGATIFQDGRGYTVLVGRAGKPFITIPGKNIAKLGNLESFIGRDIVKSREGAIILRSFLKTKQGQEIIKSIKKSATLQGTIGQIASTKAGKFIYPRLKIPGGLEYVKNKRTVEDVMSASAILNQGEISKIIGSAATRSGSRINFAGIIKAVIRREGLQGVISSGKKIVLKGVSQLEQARLNAALKKVATLTAGAIAESNKIKQLNPVARTAYAAVVLKRNLVGRPLSPGQKSNLVTILNKVDQRALSKSLPRISTIEAVLSRQDQRSFSRQASTTRQVQGLSTRQEMRQESKQGQMMRQAQKSATRQALRQMQRSTTARPFPTMIPGLPFIPIFVKRNGKTYIHDQGKPIQGFAVIEKRGKGNKFYRVNKRPLPKAHAYDLLAYLLDNRISRTGKVISVGFFKVLALVGPRVAGYYQKTKNKFRPYKIKRGKKIPFSQGFLERAAYSLDRPGEKRQINLNRMMKRR